MLHYLIENLMGCERPLAADELENLRDLKEKYESHPMRTVVGSRENRVEVQASYYIVPKGDWDMDHCPLIPVDLS